jgi:hypothetical protein
MKSALATCHRPGSKRVKRRMGAYIGNATRLQVPDDKESEVVGAIALFLPSEVCLTRTSRQVEGG